MITLSETFLAKLVAIAVAIAIILYFCHLPHISVLILVAFVLMIIIYDKISERKKIQEELLIKYLEYCKAIPKNKSVMSYEAFKKEEIFKQELAILNKEKRKKAEEEYQKKLEISKIDLDPLGLIRNMRGKNRTPRPSILESFLAGLKSRDLRTASTNRSGRRRKQYYPTFYI
jgi:hypothetical protein